MRNGSTGSGSSVLRRLSDADWMAAVAAKGTMMAKCMECGGPVGMDGCPRCRPLGCSCCDPTHDSPDPVVVRLQKEVEYQERANDRLSEDLMRVSKGLVEALAKIDELRGLLGACRESVSSLTATTDKQATELSRLRGLLREACFMAHAPDDDPKRWYGNEITDEWFDKAAAAGGPDDRT